MFLSKVNFFGKPYRKILIGYVAFADPREGISLQSEKFLINCVAYAQCFEQHLFIV